MNGLMVAGAITGLLFGFILQKARVLRFEKQLGAVRLVDMTIVKFMLSSIIVGMVGIYLLKDLGLIELSLKSTNVAANAVGGLIFGFGWAIAGYCPGTSVGALGEGRWHAVWVILGMLVGAAIYAEVYPLMKGNILSWGGYGKITLPGILGVNHWVVIAVFIVFSVVLFAFFEKKKL